MAQVEDRRLTDNFLKEKEKEKDQRKVPDDQLASQQANEEDGAEYACLTIKRLLPNRRIDRYLQHRFPAFSRNVIQRLIGESAVTVNGKPSKPSYQLRPGDRIDLILPPKPTEDIPPEDIPLDIIYEDENMLLINKQANLVVHPARGNRGGTLVNGLVNYSDSLSSVNGQFRPGIVHRLDRNTTGVIVVAKTDVVHWRLAHQFEHRQVQKTYLAIVHGTLDLCSDVIEVPLGRHSRVREKYAAQPESGKHALTKYTLEKQYRGYAIVRLEPKTGRTHQIRVHLALIGHPIVGDTMYGGKMMTLEQLANGQQLPENTNLRPEDNVINRQALHAAELSVRDPVTAEPLVFSAPLADDMSLLIELLDRYRSIDA